MSFYAFDLRTESEDASDEEDDALDCLAAFNPAAPQVTPRKSTRKVTSAKSETSTRQRRSSLPLRKTATPPKPRKSSSGKKMSNVFDGLTHEFAEDLNREASVCDLASSDEESDDEPKDFGEEIILVVQNKAQSRVPVRTFCNAPFKQLFDKYTSHAIDNGLIAEGASLTFLLDDEPIQKSDTPASLACQEDDIIDVVVSKT